MSKISLYIIIVALLGTAALHDKSIQGYLVVNKRLDRENDKLLSLCGGSIKKLKKVEQ